MRVLGLTSGLAIGEITEIDAVVNIPLNEGEVEFTKAIRTSQMFRPGDSGALVVDEEGYAAGILVAGSEQASYLAPVQEVLDTLGVQLVYAGAELANLQGHTRRIWTVAWSPDGRLISGSRDSTAIIWDLMSEKPAVVLEGHPGEIFSARFSPDGTRIATAGQDGTVRIWQGK